MISVQSIALQLRFLQSDLRSAYHHIEHNPQSARADRRRYLSESEDGERRTATGLGVSRVTLYRWLADKAEPHKRALVKVGFLRRGRVPLTQPFSTSGANRSMGTGRRSWSYARTAFLDWSSIPDPNGARTEGQAKSSRPRWRSAPKSFSASVRKSLECPNLRKY